MRRSGVRFISPAPSLTRKPRYRKGSGVFLFGRFGSSYRLFTDCGTRFRHLWPLHEPSIHGPTFPTRHRAAQHGLHHRGQRQRLQRKQRPRSSSALPSLTEFATQGGHGHKVNTAAGLPILPAPGPAALKAKGPEIPDRDGGDSLKFTGSKPITATTDDSLREQPGGTAEGPDG
jgi:hypothetical protein